MYANTGGRAKRAQPPGFFSTCLTTFLRFALVISIFEETRTNNEGTSAFPEFRATQLLFAFLGDLDRVSLMCC